MATIRTSIQLEDRMSRQFGAINSAMISTIEYMEQMNSASGNMFDTSAMQNAQIELRQMESYYAQMEQEIMQAEDAQRDYNRTISQGENTARSLLGTLGALVGAYLSFEGIKKTIGLSDELTSTTARVQLLVDDMPLIPDQEANVDFNALGMSNIEAAQQLIYESAQRSYASFKDTADMVSRIGSNAGDAFESVAEVVAFSELVQKQFGIAGANANEASNATLQLSQALASGVLRGDELNSIFEQAPNLIHSIADYMGEPIGAIREMAADGLITADIVKNAMFAAADDINNKFDSMPITWNKLWTYFQNGAQRVFGNVLGYINQIANSERMKEFVDNTITNLAILSSVAMGALNAMTTVGSFLYDNWSAISPIVTMVSFAVGGLALALGAVVAAKMATALWTSIATTAAVLYAAATGAGTGATWSMVAAAWGLNAALAANPVFLIVMGIMLLIGVIYAAVGAYNHLAGESVSATGLIVGALATAGAFIANVLFGIAEVAFGVIEYLYNNWIAFANTFANMFNDPVGAVIRLFGELGDNVLGVIEKIASAIDFVFGSNLASAVAGWRSELAGLVNWAAEEYGNGKYEVLFEELDVTKTLEGLGIRAERFDYGNVWDSANDWGANLFNTDKLGVDQAITHDYGALANLANLDNIASTLGGIEDAVKDTAGNTAKLKNSIDFSKDDLKYLRDAAEQKSINRYTTEVKVDMSGMNNSINSELDIDGIIHHLVNGTEEAMNSIGEGV